MTSQPAQSTTQARLNQTTTKIGSSSSSGGDSGTSASGGFSALLASLFTTASPSVQTTQTVPADTNGADSIPVAQPQQQQSASSGFGDPFGNNGSLIVGFTAGTDGQLVFNGNFQFPGSPPEGQVPTVAAPPVATNPQDPQILLLATTNTATSALSALQSSTATLDLTGVPLPTDDQTDTSLLTDNTATNPAISALISPLLNIPLPAVTTPFVSTNSAGTTALSAIAAGQTAAILDQQLTTSANLANQQTATTNATATTNTTVTTTANATTTPLFPAVNTTVSNTTASTLFPATTNSASATTPTTTSTVTQPVTTPAISVASTASLTTTTTTVQNPNTVQLTSTTTGTAQDLINGGRSIGLPTLAPGLPQLPQVQPSTADANPGAFFSITGIDRPADAVSTLDSLGPISTTLGGATAQFTRERTDIADLNSLFRGDETKAPSDNSAAVAGGNFTKLIDSSTSTTSTPADQQPPVLKQIADAVAERAQVVRDGGNTEIRLRLDPPDLGTINIRIHSQNGELRAEITAADPAVRTMIDSQLNDLKSRLQQSGLDFQSFNLSSGGGSNRGDQAADAQEFAGTGRRTLMSKTAPVNTQSSSVVNPNRGSLLDVTV